MSLTGRCEHNCIQIRHWWRTRWVCVRCHRIFNYDATEGAGYDELADYV